MNESDLRSDVHYLGSSERSLSFMLFYCFSIGEIS